VTSTNPTTTTTTTTTTTSSTTTRPHHNHGYVERETSDQVGVCGYVNLNMEGWVMFRTFRTFRTN